jgi:predicted amidohydrolase
MEFTVALLQIAPFGSDQGRNLAKGLQCCRDAKVAGADLVVLPELWNIGCTPCPIDDAGRRSWIASAIDQRSDFFGKFIALAQELSISIAVTYLESHQPKPRNTVSIINDRGDVVLNYSKVFICDFGAEELLKPNPNIAEIGCDVNCSPGESFPVCTLVRAGGEVRVGAMICADREFPEAATQLMLNGAELIVVPNACTWDDIRTAGLKTRAFENLVGVAMANYPGARFGSSQAHTCVVWKGGKPQNTLIASAGDHEKVLLATFDIDDIRSFRKAESWRLDYRLLRHRGLNYC